MSDDVYFRIIKNYINNLPGLPVTVTKMKNICDNPKSLPADIYKIIILDPVLIAKVMKLFNSVYSDITEKDISIVRAIIMLGINTVKNLVINSSAISFLNNKTNFQEDTANKFWIHSFCTATVAKIIAIKTGKNFNEAEEYFIAGMLHDIGKIPILSCFPEQYRVIADKSKENESSLFRSEQKVLGFDHCVVGKMITKQWSLGEKMELVIANHHNPLLAAENKYWEIVYIISVADYFINKIKLGFASAPPVPPHEVFKRTGVTEEILENIKEDIFRELEKAEKFIGS